MRLLRVFRGRYWVCEKPETLISPALEQSPGARQVAHVDAHGVSVSAQNVAYLLGAPALWGPAKPNNRLGKLTVS
jgi:hypothetical protein